MKEREEKLEWDKKKILFFLGAITLLLFAAYILKEEFLSSQTSTAPMNKAEVEGVSTQDPLTAPEIKKNIQNQITNLQTEAEKINVVDIATSSPQVQKVINDLKALQDYPKSQLKTTCEQICNSL